MANRCTSASGRSGDLVYAPPAPGDQVGNPVGTQAWLESFAEDRNPLFKDNSTTRGWQNLMVHLMGGATLAR